MWIPKLQCVTVLVLSLFVVCVAVTLCCCLLDRVMWRERDFYLDVPFSGLNKGYLVTDKIKDELMLS